MTVPLLSCANKDSREYALQNLSCYSVMASQHSNSSRLSFIFYDGVLPENIILEVNDVIIMPIYAETFIRPSGRYKEYQYTIYVKGGHASIGIYYLNSSIRADIELNYITEEPRRRLLYVSLDKCGNLNLQIRVIPQHGQIRPFAPKKTGKQGLQELIRQKRFCTF